MSHHSYYGPNVHMCEHNRNQNEPEPCTCLANAERRFIFHPSKHQSKHHITSTTSLQQNKMTPKSDGTATAKFTGVKNWPRGTYCRQQ